MRVKRIDPSHPVIEIRTTADRLIEAVMVQVRTLVICLPVEEHVPALERISVILREYADALS